MNIRFSEPLEGKKKLCFVLFFLLVSYFSLQHDSSPSLSSASPLSLFLPFRSSDVASLVDARSATLRIFLYTGLPMLCKSFLFSSLPSLRLLFFVYLYVYITRVYFNYCYCYVHVMYSFFLFCSLLKKKRRRTAPSSF